MILYHGTSADRAKRILEEGLVPRGMSGEDSNFPVHPSSAGYVYLSDCYAPYFAAVAAANARCKLSKKSRFVLIEVDVAQGRLAPDEDFMEQATRDTPNEPAGDMAQRTAWFRDRLADYKLYWHASLTHLGTVAHAGVIKPNRIGRVVEYNPRSNIWISSMCIDPSITTLNHRFLSAKYKMLTKWFFDELNNDELLDLTGLSHLRSLHPAHKPYVDEAFRKQLDTARKAAAERDGLRVVRAGFNGTRKLEKR